MKTVEEWSNAFDTLVDSYRRFKDFDKKLELDSIEFDEYQKSLYLTKAQEEIIKEVYSSTSSSFEDTEKSRRELDSLVKTCNCQESEGTILYDKFNHKSFDIPQDCWYIVYEQVKYNSENNCVSSIVSDVVPVTHDEYQRVIKNPFRGPKNTRVLRLDIGKLKVELVSSNIIDTYTIRYLSQPEPIVLCDLQGDGINMQGINCPNTCKLTESIHQQILDRAVRSALSSRINNTNKKE